MSPVSSPCVGICQLDTASKICLGCGRTLEEIANWQLMDAMQKHQVMKRLPPRLERLQTAREAIGIKDMPQKPSSRLN